MADPAPTSDIKSDSEPWSVLENLILAQAIHKCGDTNWVAIARTIKGHPQVHRSNNFFSQKSCAIQYTLLLENLEAETRSKQSRGNEAGSSATQDIPTVVKLAGQLYHQRILEIKALIRKDEERFRALVAELDEIRQGKWDSQLEEELKNNPSPLELTVEAAPTTDNSAAPELSNDSPLTDMTQSQPQQKQLADGDNASSLAGLAESSVPSNPSSSAVPGIQESSSQMVDGAEMEVAATGEAPTTAAVEQISEVVVEDAMKKPQEIEDVEMEDVAESTQSLQTPVDSTNDMSSIVDASTAPTNGDQEEDVEMEDATSNEVPPTADPTEEPESTAAEQGSEATETVHEAKKPSTSDSSSPTSASDLSPPEAMEDDEVTPENASQTPKTKSEDAAVEKDTQEEQEMEEAKEIEAVIKAEEKDEMKADEAEADEVETGEVGTDEEEKEEQEEEQEEEEAESASQRERVQARGARPEPAQEESEEVVLKEEDEEESKLSVQDENNELERDEEDTAHEGVTSADEETGSTTRSARKPRKIKTSNVPTKRRRRSGRGAAGAEHNDEGGYNSSDSEATDSTHTNISSDQLMRNQMDDKKWKKILMMIWSDIANHRFGAVFMQPIKEQDAPGYYYMVKRPMDLKSIKERIRDGQITNADEFHRDVLLMFMNALMYNGEDTEVYHMALAMMSEVEFIIKNFKSSQSFAPASGGASALGASGAAGGSNNTSTSTTPTTRTASGAGAELLSAGPGSGQQPSSRKRKSSGLEMTPVE
ncbi:Bromodomain-containing protein 8 [Mortierella claussenii]|nr:Bromodomain-containing protein 8 [Mortierella claussenii]